ncbi:MULTISPECIES: permease-like cell division protein FtsX [Terrabacteria group]|uniref:permease-like cell division protein FtsX n=1 Tax=Bacillati TaxID=1783272 RepID=UPI001C6E3BD3|nr:MULTISPECIES: permease-like cell division protein FtsX [Terrabacteria group]MBW9212663.1 permease-like cell division protein FtsX [Trueperella sp. zg.1013]
MISRPFKEGISGVGRHWAMSISSALAVTITLIIISLISILSINLQSFTKSIENTVQISVQVAYEAEGNEANIKNQILAIDGVAKVNFSSKAQELEYYLNSFDDEKTRKIFEPFKEENPMHDSFYVEAKSGNKIESIAKEIRKIKGIYSVNYGGQSTITLVTAMNGIRRSGLILGAGLGILAIFLIQNTIRLTIFSRQDEITIMKNVGATNHFIRSPFLIEGMLIGIMGSIIPIVLTAWSYIYIYNRTNGILLSSLFRLYKPNPFVVYVSLALAAVGMGVGLVGSFISVNRYLRQHR